MGPASEPAISLDEAMISDLLMKSSTRSNSPFVPLIRHKWECQEGPFVVGLNRKGIA